MNNQENIKVVVRVRPPLENEKRLCVDVDDRNNQISIVKDDYNKTTFGFDHIAGISTKQIEMMQLIGKPITDKCLAGYNGTIFAYGQTGSGKTFTMKGDFRQKPHNLGLMPNIFAYLFDQFERIKSKSIEECGECNVEYSVKVSCCEIYNYCIRDLLVKNSGNLQLKEHKNRGFFVKGLSEQICKSAKHCLKFVEIAGSHRKTASTKMNIHSSRSHLIFSIIINRTKMLNDSNNNNNNIDPKKLVKSRTSRLNLVDLAGSERQKKTNATGDRLKESKHINASLSTLGLVISSIIKNEKHIPFRNSELTKLLKDSLGGNSLTFMVANISPSKINSAETLSTLQFANRAKQIKNKAKINKDIHPSLQALKAENSKFVHIVEQLTKKYQASQQQNNELNKINTALQKENIELKSQKVSLTKSLQTKDDEIEELEAKINNISTLNTELTSNLNTQKQEIQQLVCKQQSTLCTDHENENENENENKNENENDNSIHGLCSCDPWILIQNTKSSVSPKINRKRTHQQSNDNINIDIQKSKKRKISNIDKTALSSITSFIVNQSNININTNWIESYLKRLNDLSMDELIKLFDQETKQKLNDNDLILIKQEMEHRLLQTPPIDFVRKQQSKFFNEFGYIIDTEWKEIKTKRTEQFIDSIFSNNYVEKLEAHELIQLIDNYKMQKNRLKKLEKERRDRMHAITNKKYRGAQMYKKDINDYQTLLRVTNKSEIEREKLVDKSQRNDWKQLRKQIKENGINLYDINT